MLETRIRQHARTVDRNTAGRVPRWIGPILFLGFCCPAALRAELILDLNDRARIALTPHQQGVAIFEMAYVHAAIYDAVNAIDGRYTFFAVTPSSVPEGSSKEAAAIAAAYVVLIARVPANAAALAAERDGLLSAIPDGPGKTNGIAIGVEVGQGILDFRKDDGLDAAPPPYAFGSGPAEYQQIPIFQPRVDPINQNFATMRPFALLSPSQFRAPGPSDLKSKRWADDYNEVRARGAKSSTVRTPEETNLGISYTENGMVYYTRIYHNVSVAYDLGLEDNARFFAMLYLSQADSFIAVFDSKYHYRFWRPYTAIHAGDTDRNPLTDPDPDWVPLVVTPAHPEYPAAHGVGSGSAAETLRTFFHKKKIDISFLPAAPGYAGGEIAYHSTDGLIKAVIEGRILGGMHYRTSGRQGAIMGRKVSRWLTKHHFRRVHGHRGRGGEVDEFGRLDLVVDGDSNGDGVLNVSDPIYALGYLFLGTGGTPPCLRASDANDDGVVDISDTLYTLSFLFLGGPAPLYTVPEPGSDPFADRLNCQIEEE